MSFQQSVRIAVALLILGLSLMVVGERADSHVPITTRITFNREVVRILRQHCLECHSPRGVKSDQPLLTYAEARPWAKAIKEEILNRRMAPYRAVPGYGHFLESYHLPSRDQELLVSWIEGGVPRGEEKDYPSGLIAELSNPPSWTAGEPDQILQPRSETTIGAAPYTGRQCFSLQVGNSGPRRVRLAEFIPGNGRVVYRASLHLAPAAGRGPRRTTRVNPCNIPERALTPIAEWVPGQRSFPYPPGMALALPPQSVIALRIEYHGINGPETDQSRVGLFFADSTVVKAVETINITSSTFSSSPRRVVEFPLSADREIIAIRPVLRPGSGSFEARLIRPDGSSEVLVFVRNYRFDWNPTYHFNTPRPAPRGSVISIAASSESLADPLLCQVVVAK